MPLSRNNLTIFIATPHCFLAFCGISAYFRTLFYLRIIFFSTLLAGILVCNIQMASAFMTSATHTKHMNPFAPYFFYISVIKDSFGFIRVKLRTITRYRQNIATAHLRWGTGMRVHTVRIMIVNQTSPAFPPRNPPPPPLTPDIPIASVPTLSSVPPGSPAEYPPAPPPPPAINNIPYFSL